MTEAPHLFVHATVEVNGRTSHGISADGLPPKWFTKNLDTTFEDDDLPSMLRVIRHAVDVGQELGIRSSFFSWWRDLSAAQNGWAEQNQIAKLLASFGVSLVERAVLDAVCRQLRLSLFRLLQTNAVEADFSSVRAALKGMTPVHVMPRRAAQEVNLRHTIGLGDALSGKDTASDPADGLPFTLEENIQEYGLSYFKVKLSGDKDFDRDRLIEIASILGRMVGDAARFTLDGNENYQTIASFREAWNDLHDANELRSFFSRSLLFVEQPVHRSCALDAAVRDELRSWPDAPPIIIDESDAELASVPRALSLGYSGTSHKNCKGIMKGLLNLATISATSSSERKLILSAEDLGNVGPVALLQDLAVVAALGIPHVERNGHHYFAGLSMFPHETQGIVQAQHPDLYEDRNGLIALAPRHGKLALQSVNEAPFGVGPLVDVEQFEPWEF